MSAGSNPLAGHYSRFRVSERLLLTGHSHQAWPDVAVEGQLEAVEDAAALVDEKWERSQAKAERVREGFRAFLGDPGGEIALGGSTHDLLIRLLSALDLRRRPRLVSTDGEFHTIRRQLSRLGEESWIEVTCVPARPVQTLAERLAAEARHDTAAVLVSAVLFEDARIVPGLDELAGVCAARGVELVIDAYHALGPVPFSTPSTAWVLGGGYKYLQLGEGNCFLRLPPHAHELRPIVTGWFAEFDELADAADPRQVGYGRGASAFAGSTYDPTSHYRASRVLEFFSEQGLTPAALQVSYQSQLRLLADAFDRLGAAPGLITRDRDTALQDFAGFLALRSPKASNLSARLRREGVLTDSRGDYLRLGPAPYLADAQLERSIDILGSVLRTSSLGGGG